MATPESLEGISPKRRSEIAKAADDYIKSKTEPFLMTSAVGLIYYPTYAKAGPLLYGQPAPTAETRYGYSGRFVILPELLNAQGLEQLYNMFCLLHLADHYKYGGDAKKADNWFLKESVGEREDAPAGSFYCELKKAWATPELVRPLIVVDRDEKPLPPETITSGSLIRPQIWFGTPEKPTYGKRIWGSIKLIQVVRENTGQVATLESRSISDDVSAEDNEAAADAYDKLGNGNTPALTGSVQGESSGGDMESGNDGDMPF